MGTPNTQIYQDDLQTDILLRTGSVDISAVADNLAVYLVQTVGQVLYHVRADRPSELRCSWGGPANHVGGNGPADGEWCAPPDLTLSY